MVINTKVMKSIIIVFCGALALALSAQTTNEDYAKDGSLNYFELNKNLEFGSDKYDKELLEIVRKKGDRDKISGYIFDRANQLDITIWMSFVYNNMYVTWVERNKDKMVVEKSIMISFDAKNIPIAIKSVAHVVGPYLKRGVPAMGPLIEWGKAAAAPSECPEKRSEPAEEAR